MRRYVAPACVATAAAVALIAVGVTGAGASGAARGAPHAVRVASGAASLELANPGAQVWVKRYNGGGYDDAESVAVSPTGKVVFVTGQSAGASGYLGYATVAYNAASGARLWVKRYDGPANSLSVAESVAVSPTGKTVFVTGGSAQPGGSVYATVAYNATTGAEQWVRRYSGPANATSVAVSPNGGTVYVTGEAFSPVSSYDYVTIA